MYESGNLRGYRVNRHTGGLEIDGYCFKALFVVNRHTGGLETFLPILRRKAPSFRSGI